MNCAVEGRSGPSEIFPSRVELRSRHSMQVCSLVTTISEARDALSQDQSQRWCASRSDTSWSTSSIRQSSALSRVFPTSSFSTRPLPTSSPQEPSFALSAPRSPSISATMDLVRSKEAASQVCSSTWPARLCTSTNSAVLPSQVSVSCDIDIHLEDQSAILPPSLDSLNHDERSPRA